MNLVLFYGLTSTTQNKMFCVAQLRSSGEDHWSVAREQRVYDTRINRAESRWVQNMGPSLTHKGHATRDVGGVRLPRNVQKKRGGRKTNQQQMKGVRQRRHLGRVTIAMHGIAECGHVTSFPPIPAALGR